MQDQSPDLSIFSAGVAAVTGQPIDDTVRWLLHQRGSSSGDEHESTPLTRRLVRRSALIVTATREHRVAVVRLDRSAAERAFTLKELARVAAASPARITVAGLAAAATSAAAIDEHDHDDDLDDPFGHDLAAYERMAAEADAAASAILRVLA